MKRSLPLFVLLLARVASANSVPAVQDVPLTVAPQPASIDLASPPLETLLPQKSGMRKAGIGLLASGGVLTLATVIALSGYLEKHLTEMPCNFEAGVAKPGGFNAPKQCGSTSGAWASSAIGFGVPALVTLVTGATVFAVSRKLPAQWKVPSVDLLTERGAQGAVAHAGFSF